MRDWDDAIAGKPAPTLNGLFIGPTLLAVAYSLLIDWIATHAQNL